MRRTTVELAGRSLPLHSLNTLVIGSGAAALAAACRLHELGQTDLALVTERMGGGTSHNAGSDKQTYYKVSLAGARPDDGRLFEPEDGIQVRRRERPGPGTSCRRFPIEGMGTSSSGGCCRDCGILPIGRPVATTHEELAPRGPIGG